MRPSDTVKILEDDTTVQFEYASHRVSETNGTLLLYIDCLGRSRGPCSVDYATVDGTATAGIDYTHTAGTVSMHDRGQGRGIMIPLQDNHTWDGDRTFYVVLSHPSTNVTLGEPRTVTITIEDDGSCRLVITTPPASGQLTLTLFGRVGARLVIEASTDLVQWTQLETVTNTTGQVEFTDPDHVNFRHRFYRARQVE